MLWGLNVGILHQWTSGGGGEYLGGAEPIQTCPVRFDSRETIFFFFLVLALKKYEREICKYASELRNKICIALNLQITSNLIFAISLISSAIGDNKKISFH